MSIIVIVVRLSVEAGNHVVYMMFEGRISRGVTSVPADSNTIRILQMRGRKLAFDVMECPSVAVEERELDDPCRRLSSYRLPLTPEKLESFDVIKKGGTTSRPMPMHCSPAIRSSMPGFNAHASVEIVT